MNQSIDQRKHGTIKPTTTTTPEQNRLGEAREQRVPWKKWGPYLVSIASATIHAGGDTGMWDEEDGFFYDVLQLPNGHSQRLKVRSMVGLLPLCAVTVFDRGFRDQFPEIAKRFQGRALLQYYAYYGNEFTVECPTGSGRLMNLYQVAEELARRLASLFLKGKDGRRPVNGGEQKLQEDPHWRDYLQFYEYFHGDHGAGLGASHQTGWTGVIARAMHLFATTTADQTLEIGTGVVLGQIEPPAKSGEIDIVPPSPKVPKPTTTPNHP